MVSKLLFRKRPNQEPEYDMDEIRKKLEETDFEKGDTMALIIAAMITIIPVMLIMILAIVGVIWLIFLR